MADGRRQPIQFDLDDDHRRAIEALAGERTVRLSGRVEGGKLSIDFVACNAPFLACNAPFVRESLDLGQRREST